jgi:hypothetical protein
MVKTTMLSPGELMKARDIAPVWGCIEVSPPMVPLAANIKVTNALEDHHMETATMTTAHNTGLYHNLLNEIKVGFAIMTMTVVVAIIMTLTGIVRTTRQSGEIVEMIPAHLPIREHILSDRVVSDNVVTGLAQAHHPHLLGTGGRFVGLKGKV